MKKILLSLAGILALLFSALISFEFGRDILAIILFCLALLPAGKFTEGISEYKERRI